MVVIGHVYYFAHCAGIAFELNWFKRIHNTSPIVNNADQSQADSLIPDVDPNTAFRIDLPNASKQFPDNWISDHFPCPLSSWEFRLQLHEYPQHSISVRDLLARKSLWEGRARFYILHPHDVLASNVDLRPVFRKVYPQPSTLYFFTLHRISDRFKRQTGVEFIVSLSRVPLGS